MTIKDSTVYGPAGYQLAKLHFLLIPPGRILFLWETFPQQKLWVIGACTSSTLNELLYLATTLLTLI